MVSPDWGPLQGASVGQLCGGAGWLGVLPPGDVGRGVPVHLTLQQGGLVHQAPHLIRDVTAGTPEGGGD